MKAVLVLNGQPPALEFLRQHAEHAPVFAADGGALICRDAGVVPKAVVGDFDCFDRAEIPSDWPCEKIPDQDSTDFEKLLRYIPEEVRDVIVLGGFGKRLDHLITNLLIASALPPSLGIRFEDSCQVMVRITPEHPLDESPPPGTTLSLLPFSHVTGVRSQGLHWNLEDEDMNADLKLGQSNEVKGGVEVRVRSGSLFAWFEQGCGQ